MKLLFVHWAAVAAIAASFSTAQKPVVITIDRNVAVAINSN